MNAQELAHRLEIVTGRRYQRAGSGYLGPCVAHDDRNPSMTIFDGHTAAQVRCKAGCEQSAVIDALKRLGVWDCRQAAPPVRLSIPKPPQDDTAAGRMKAKWLWSKRQPLIRSLAETYLRKHRGITCMPPPTLEFLPADSTYPPAMIAALGFAQEIEPGGVAIDEHAVMAVHLTRLTPDGRKLGADPKIMLGRGALGVHILLARLNDLLGLVIAEGIEDALSMHQATGLGAWAAGSASRMPALADTVPSYCDCVTILADNNEAGERNAALLAERLGARCIHAEIIPSAGATP